VQVGSPHGHESASNCKEAFQQAAGRRREVRDGGLDADEAIAGGEEEGVFTLETFLAGGARGQHERPSRKEKDTRAHARSHEQAVGATRRGVFGDGVLHGDF